MRRMAKIKAFLFDAAVLIAVVGGLGLACELGDLRADSAQIAPAHLLAQAAPRTASF